MSVIILELVFKAFLPNSFSPWIQQRFNKTKHYPEEGPYAVTHLNPKTSPVNMTNFIANTALINRVSCISIHCNSYSEFYCAEDLFLKCNVKTQGISLSSNSTSSAFFVTKGMVMDYIYDCSTGLYKGKSNLWYPVLEGKCRLVKRNHQPNLVLYLYTHKQPLV